MKKNLFFICSFLISFSTFSQSNDPIIKGLIKKTEKAMGGQKAFDAIHHLSWNFFNARTLTWNKKTGDVRIDNHKENTVYLYNLENKTGRVLKNGVEYTQKDSLDKYLTQAYQQWVNDSYWLIMPFKLDDPGVNLEYIGKKNAIAGASCDVLQLTFDQVGVTPQNKYLVYIDEQTDLVCQWDYFPKISDTEPRFSTPWNNYQTYEKVKLSGDRGERQITNIHVYKKLDAAVYTEFERPSFIK